jgi:hypothetical protein
MLVDFFFVLLSLSSVAGCDADVGLINPILRPLTSKNGPPRRTSPFRSQLAIVLSASVC